MNNYNNMCLYPIILRSFDILSSLCLGTIGTALFLSVLTESIAWHFVFSGLVALTIAAYATLLILQNLTIRKISLYLLLGLPFGICLLFFAEAGVLIMNELPLSLLWDDSSYVNKVFFEQNALYYVFVFSFLYLIVSGAIRKNLLSSLAFFRNQPINLMSPLILIGLIGFFVAISVTQQLNEYEWIIISFTLVSLSFVMVGITAILLIFLMRQIPIFTKN